MEEKTLKFENYTDGLDMNQFEHVKEGSTYNHNFYSGFGLDLLCGKSDDYNTTEWYIMIMGERHYLGESKTSEGDVLRRYENQQW